MTNLCIFAHYDQDGIVDPYVLAYLTALRDCGFSIVFVTVCRLSEGDKERLKERCFDVIERENIGHDFGSWSVGLAKYRAVSQGRLLIANDSVYGPIGSLKESLEILTSQRADFYGMVLSNEIVPHLQSWFLLFEPHVVASQAFADVFCQPPMHRPKEDVIRDFELRATRHLNSAGFECRALFESGMRGLAQNPTAYLWERLIERDHVPFLKVGIARDDPTSCMPDNVWCSVVRRVQPDLLPVIEAHLARVRGHRVAAQPRFIKRARRVMFDFVRRDDTFARRKAVPLIKANAGVMRLAAVMPPAFAKGRSLGRSVLRPMFKALPQSVQERLIRFVRGRS